jgi:flagellar biosynthesis protein FliQ
MQDTATIARAIEALFSQSGPRWLTICVSLVALVAALLRTFIDFRPSRWRRDEWEVMKIKAEVMALQREHALPSVSVIDALITLHAPNPPFSVRYAFLFLVPLKGLELAANLLGAGAWVMALAALGLVFFGSAGLANSQQLAVLPSLPYAALAVVAFALVGWMLGKIADYFEQKRLRIELERETFVRRRQIAGAA